MKKILLIGGVLALLLTVAAGCQSDRPDGDAPAEKKSSAKAAKKKPRRRDPADDMFFGVGKGAKAESFSSDQLSPREQRLLSEELRRQDEEMSELRRRRREMDSGRSRRKEWVYGFKPLWSN